MKILSFNLHTKAILYQPMESDSPLRRFKRSMIIDYEKWHDGISYDLTALREATPEERVVIEEILTNRKPLSWRDIEALAILDTPKAQETLRMAASDANSEVQMAVIRYAPQLLSIWERSAIIIRALKTANLYGGLSQALDEVVEFHPPKIISELFNGVLKREGEVAVLFAAMLAYIYGKADGPFDMRMRPFFLRFNTDVKALRREVFHELCELIGVDPNVYLQDIGR